MSEIAFTKDDIAGIEPKHITYVLDRQSYQSDCLFVKEVVHLKDGRKVPRLVPRENYERSFYITHKGLQTHQEKKDYERKENLQEYRCKQFELTRRIAKITRNYSLGPNPRLRELARSPYLYGADISSGALLKNDYRSKWPDALSLNSVAGGDIETNVVRSFKNGADIIICMSVTFKSQVRLVYLKEWMADVVDPIGETHAKARELIGDLIDERQLNIEVLLADTPAQVAMLCIEKLHEWKPDFWSFWNISFDFTKIMKALDAEGIDPKDVFSDPSVIDRYKYFKWLPGNPSMTTASGVDKAKGPEDIWNWVTFPATFQPIDAMTTYRITRITDGKDPSYKLDAILDKELNEEHTVVVNTQADMDALLKLDAELRKKHKGGFVYRYCNGGFFEGTWTPTSWVAGDEFVIEVDYRKLRMPQFDRFKGLRWHEEMQEHHKVFYGVYNIVDSIRLEQLDEKTKDLASSISMYSKNSDYQNFNSNPKRLIDDMHFWYLNRGEVIGTSSDEMQLPIDQFVVGHDRWIVTLPSYMSAPAGLRCIEELPFYHTLIFAHVMDLDIVATYPNVSQLLNIARETCVMELSTIGNLTERVRREVGVNITGGRSNAVELSQKIFGAPALDDMLALYEEHRLKKPPEVSNGPAERLAG